MVIELTTENFDQEIRQHSGLALVDFWAPWCGPCRRMAPVVEEIATDYAGRVKVGKLNTDESIELSTEFKILSIPTLILFRDGAPVERIAGARPKAAVASQVEKWLIEGQPKG